MTRQEISAAVAALTDANRTQLLECVQHIYNIDAHQANDIINNTQDPAELSIVTTWLNGYISGAFEYLKLPADPCFTTKQF